MGLEADIDLVAATARRLDTSKSRALIAIAGPPASGKSTLAEGVKQRLDALGFPCGFVPMDGFHLSNEVLSERQLLDRKGAPETFDAAGFCALVEELLLDGEVSVPHFNRGRDCVEVDADVVTRAQRHVVVEGNYLFLQQAGWRRLAAFWSLRVFISPPLNVLKERLVGRWLSYGLTADQAVARAELNDLPNAAYILEHSDLTRVNLRLT